MRRPDLLEHNGLLVPLQLLGIAWTAKRAADQLRRIFD
jgi:hypothetical protein